MCRERAEIWPLHVADLSRSPSRSDRLHQTRSDRLHNHQHLMRPQPRLSLKPGFNLGAVTKNQRRRAVCPHGGISALGRRRRREEEKKVGREIALFFSPLFSFLRKQLLYIEIQTKPTHTGAHAHAQTPSPAGAPRPRAPIGRQVGPAGRPVGGHPRTCRAPPRHPRPAEPRGAVSGPLSPATANPARPGPGTPRPPTDPTAAPGPLPGAVPRV